MDRYNIRLDILLRLTRTYLWLWHAGHNPAHLRELYKLRTLINELKASHINDITLDYKLTA